MSWRDFLFGSSAALRRAQRDAAEKRALILNAYRRLDEEAERARMRERASALEATDIRVGAASQQVISSTIPSAMSAEETPT